jgi:hypothetical protein
VCGVWYTLRIQYYRVCGEVDLVQHIIMVVAIGHKDHNKLFIGGEEIIL